MNGKKVVRIPIWGRLEPVNSSIGVSGYGWTWRLQVAIISKGEAFCLGFLLLASEIHELHGPVYLTASTPYEKLSCEAFQLYMPIH
jgi:hypothetical protein